MGHEHVHVYQTLLVQHTMVTSDQPRLRGFEEADLLQRNALRLVVVAVHDGLLVDHGPRHVAPLADRQERLPLVLRVRPVNQRLQAAQAHQRLDAVLGARRVR